MALVVLLRGVNVGGHRAFRPTAVRDGLRHLEVISIGAAGTFVVRRPVTKAQLRDEFARRLPFETDIIICPGRAILGLVAEDPFSDLPRRPDIVPFVSVLAGRARAESAVPAQLPQSGEWALKVLGQRDQFVFGLYRRQMQAIRYLGTLERLLRVPVTTRNWNTVTAIAKALG